MTNSVSAHVDAQAVDRIYKEILSGSTDFELLEFIEERFPENVSSELLAKVVDILRRPIDPHIATMWSIHATRMVYAKMLENFDYAGALKAAKQMAELAHKLDLPDEFECLGGVPTKAENVKTKTASRKTTKRAKTKSAKEISGDRSTVATSGNARKSKTRSAKREPAKTQSST